MSFDSIMAIKEFERKNNLVNKEGCLFLAAVTAFVNNTTVFYGNVDCNFSYDYDYSQYEITIDWLLSKQELEQKGLHLGYNTNFQQFNCVNNELVITDKNTEITISFISD